MPDKPSNYKGAPYRWAGYEWSRPGVMKMYDGITREEAMDVIKNLVLNSKTPLGKQMKEVVSKW